jgi:uncharacterized surface protein with fasciclin (FAS1) repeats
MEASNMNRFLAIAVALFLTAPFANAGNHGHKAEEPQQPNLISVAREAGNFTTLLAAIDAAGLTETLEGEGPFTVFAPTDAAFAALPEGAVEGLLDDPEALTAVLTYHVVAGKTLAAEVTALDSVTTLQGGSLDVSTADGVKIGGATVVAADITASNGVIHVIDAVLIP